MKDLPIKGYFLSKKYGEVIIYDDCTDNKYYTLEFKNTGYTTRSTLEAIYGDCIRDRLYKNVAGVACLGYAEPSDDKKAYGIWATMINRCYNKNYRDYRKYGEKGYTVCNKWLRFDYFLEDYRNYNRPTEYKTNFIIKKDLINKNIKEFCFDNCEFISDRIIPDPRIVYHSMRSGDYRIIGREYDKNNKLRYKIKFEQTGYETLVFGSEVRNNMINDPYYPRVSGVGYVGNADYKNHKREYSIWHSMLDRCYNKDNKRYYNYGGAGVTVDKRWHCFEYFLEDFMNKKNYQNWKDFPGDYELDKDKAQLYMDPSLKVYSNETCDIIPAEENLGYRQLEALRNTKNNYYGLYQLASGNWNVKVNSNGITHTIGTYTNEIAAANARDWWARYYGVYPLNESLGLPYMPPEEWVKYNSTSKQLYHLVDKPKQQMYHLINKNK